MLLIFSYFQPYFEIFKGKIFQRGFVNFFASVIIKENYSQRALLKYFFEEKTYIFLFTKEQLAILSLK